MSSKRSINFYEHLEGIAKKVQRWNVEVSELIVGIMFIDIPEILDSNFLLTSGPIYAILHMLKRNTFYTKVVATESNGFQFREETMEICPIYRRLSSCDGNDKVGKFRCCFHFRSSVRFRPMISRSVPLR
ncbi:unnamed protein product [Cuscuta campestris]|uniref:Uncharacterized protein n=1 Tax=Cuscuta campestris TaxID=132261 RepID=A0A484MDY4_9ASTE|nr:unnamed protein product [Cuscuta campestris]